MSSRTQAYPTSANSPGMSLLRPFSRRWILTTLLVIAAMVVMARLGKWQLDRLEARRAFNARVLAQVNQPPLILSGAALSLDLSGMEYRQVIVEGEFDHANEVALRNQSWNNQIGVHLLTPLKIEGSDRYVLVDRGWVPVSDFDNHDWSQYQEPGRVRLTGVIRLSSNKPDWGRRSDPTPAPGQRLEVWNFANVEGIAAQLPYPLLPVYIQAAPDPAVTRLPYRTQPKLDLTEGPHLSYAIQWFTFAAILGLGYPFFIRRQENARFRREERSRADA